MRCSSPTNDRCSVVNRTRALTSRVSELGRSCPSAVGARELAKLSMPSGGCSDSYGPILVILEQAAVR